MGDTQAQEMRWHADLAATSAKRGQRRGKLAPAGDNGAEGESTRLRDNSGEAAKRDAEENTNTLVAVAGRLRRRDDGGGDSGGGVASAHGGGGEARSPGKIQGEHRDGSRMRSPMQCSGQPEAS